MKDTKILKIILFIGVFSYLQYYDVSHGTFDFDSITGGLVMASGVYLIASLFGIVLSLTKNYLIALVGTGALSVFLAYKLDAIILAIPWLTGDTMCIILIALVLLSIFKGVIFARILPHKQPLVDDEPLAMTEDEIANQKMRESMKANPQSVLNIANLVESELGRKPTYEEVMSRIDDFAISDLDD